MLMCGRLLLLWAMWDEAGPHQMQNWLSSRNISAVKSVKLSIMMGTMNKCKTSDTVGATASYIFFYIDCSKRRNGYLKQSEDTY